MPGGVARPVNIVVRPPPEGSTLSTLMNWRLKRKLVVFFLGFAAIVGIYPVSYPLCPKWDVTVVDSSGKPIAGMTVRRSCNDYSAGKHSKDDRVTDERGKAAFDAQRVRSPILIRWLGNVINVATQGVHASIGRYSYVFTFGGGLEGSPERDGYIETWTGRSEYMDSRIVAKPVGLRK